jgi:hypothetical protein
MTGAREAIAHARDAQVRGAQSETLIRKSTER